MEIRSLDISEWRDALPTTGFDLFHDADALEVLSDHTTGELQLLGGFKGDRPVGLFPAFVRSTSAGRTVLSPPPARGVPRLGPLVMPASPKRRKRERVNNSFVDGVVDHLGLDDRLTVVRIVSSPAYPDPRPYEWQSMRVSPSFTYQVDATGDPDELLSSFSKSLRREIRDGEELPVSVEREGLDGGMDVYEDARRRYAEQEEPFHLPRVYVRDLIDALGDRARPYVARDEDGNYLAGILALYSNDAAYFWLGGTRTTVGGTALNGMLHWRILQDIVEDPPVDTVTRYDLVGANTERLCRYKAKFGGQLIPYYVVESRGALTSVAKKAYEFASR